MESHRASVSQNGSSTTISSANTMPHYLRPSASSCHDICKYGRRRPLEEQTTKTNERIAKHSGAISTRRKKDMSNKFFTVGSHRDAKSISPKAKNHSPRKYTSPLLEKTLCTNMTLKSVKVKLFLPFQCSDGNRRRNDDVHSGRNTKKIWIPVGAPNTTFGKGRKTMRDELLSPRKDQKRVKKVKIDSSIPPQDSSSHQEEDVLEIKCNNGDEVHETPPQVEIQKVQPIEKYQIKIAGTETERSEFESIIEIPSSSSHVEDDEESDKLVVSQRKRNHNKRRRKNALFMFGDKHCQPMKLKFRNKNSIHMHEKSNIPRRLKFRRSRVEGIKPEDYVHYNKAIRIGSPKMSRIKERNRSSQYRRRRLRCGKARILVLENRKGDLRRNNQHDDNAACLELLSTKKRLHHHDLQRKKGVQVLFNHVIKETISKLAERRKGTVKSLVGAFETLISLQAHQCFFRIATARVNC